jgi:RNA polymerase sigma-70 factor, ECF subfamily
VEAVRVGVDVDEIAAQFEANRSHLKAVAYRMLGSVTEAEDAVQEAWLRLARSDADGISNMAGWLTTVVGRVCIDMLRSRRARREEYVDGWQPEPIVSDERMDPESEALLADSVGLAMLVVLETLTPAERLSFVLHDMFGVPFEDIAPIVDRTPESTRQLASRARRRVRGGAPAPDADLARQTEVVEAFLAAARAGDFQRLVAVLDPNVVFRFDNGRMVHVIAGRDQVARRAVRQGPRFAKVCRVAVVNGAAGIVVEPPVGPIGVAGLTVVNGLIVTIDLLTDPTRLRFARVG